MGPKYCMGRLIQKFIYYLFEINFNWTLLYFIWQPYIYKTICLCLQLSKYMNDDIL